MKRFGSWYKRVYSTALCPRDFDSDFSTCDCFSLAETGRKSTEWTASVTNQAATGTGNVDGLPKQATQSIACSARERREGTTGESIRQESLTGRKGEFLIAIFICRLIPWRNVAVGRLCYLLDVRFPLLLSPLWLSWFLPVLANFFLNVCQSSCFGIPP